MAQGTQFGQTRLNVWAWLTNLMYNSIGILTNAGVPTNGTSGTGVNKAGPGCLLVDITNKNLYMNSGTRTSPVWSLFDLFSVPVALTTNGAIAVASGSYAITKAGVLADTLAAPTTPAQDGIEIHIVSDTANAHTITFTGSTLDSGSAAALTATFNANKGASLGLRAYNGRWKVVNANGVSFS